MPGTNVSKQAQTFVRNITVIMHLCHQVTFQDHRGDKQGEPRYDVATI